ncbi:MAG: hypothetical protein HUU22_13585 [Phycisphaerae bacterium]|nr:hypothetical protein [Phycisphaerae bacterium]
MPLLLLFAFTLPDSQAVQSHTYIAQASFSGNGDWLALIVGRDNALNALVLLDTLKCARSVLQMPDFHHYPEPVGQIAWNDMHSSFIVYLRARANTADVARYIGSFWAFDVATGAWRALGAAREMREKEAVPKCCYDSTDDTIRYFEPASAQFMSLNTTALRRVH